MEPRHQLRVYRIEPGRMADFVAAWQAGVVPLRRRFGFEIEGAWTGAGESSDQFCWVVRFDGEGTFEAADRAYYASDERRQLADDPARFIVDQEHTMIVPLPGFEATPRRAGTEPAEGPFDPPP